MTKSSTLTHPSHSHGAGSFDSPVAACRQGLGAAGGGWTMDGLLSVLCGTDSDVVSAAGKTQKVYKVDRVYFEDKKFDGTSWQTELFEAGGTAGGGVITLLSGTSAESAATTLYHEVWHTKQPPGMGWPHPSEDDAYYNTELWTIEKGLPGQVDGSGLRVLDRAGDIVPDKAAIKDFVARAYPVSTGAAPGWDAVSYKDVPPETLWEHRTTAVQEWKAAKLGDFVPGPPNHVNKQLIPAGDFKCP